MTRFPITQVHELELSSRCNLACKYCPHPTLRREKADIAWPTFLRALRHVEHYCEAGTQGELSLTGIGEAILHPDFERMLEMCRLTIGPERPLVVSTNGVAVDQRVAKALARVRAQVYVSEHRPEVAAPAARLLAQHGVQVAMNHAFVDSSIDWAGQVDWHVSGPRHVCTYLQAGWAVVRQCGSVDACCQDAHNLHPIGHVDDPLGSWRTAPMPLCASCHLIVPEKYRERVVEVTPNPNTLGRSFAEVR